MMTPYTIAITIILLLVTVNAIQVNDSSASPLPLTLKGSKRNATDGQLVKRVYSGELPSDDSPVSNVTALFSIPWNGPPGTVRNFDLTNLDLRDAANLLNSYLDSYYNYTVNDTCPSSDLSQHLLGESLISTNRKDLSLESLSHSKKDEKCGYSDKNQKKSSAKGFSSTKNSCYGYFSFTIFGINLQVSFNYNPSPTLSTDVETINQNSLSNEVMRHKAICSDQLVQ